MFAEETIVLFDSPVLINNLVSSLGKKKRVLATFEVLPSTAGCLKECSRSAQEAGRVRGLGG